MKGRLRLLCFPALIILAALSGCAASVVSSKWSQEAADLTLNEVKMQPDAYVGRIVVWGGVIVQTTVSKQGSEMIVLKTPTGKAEPPKSREFSTGRFIARTTEFLDPAVYSEGKKVTVAGQIAGVEARPLSQMEYAYPVITIKELHIWTKARYYYESYPFYHRWWGWPGPFYHY